MANVPQNAVVWTEVPVTDLDKSGRFYSDVTGYDMIDETMGGQPVKIFAYSGAQTGVAGNLYKGKPSSEGSGPTIHLQVEGTVEQAMERVKSAGGKVVTEVVEIPNGRFAYCRDLDGNSFGVFTS